MNLQYYTYYSLSSPFQGLSLLCAIAKDFELTMENTVVETFFSEIAFGYFPDFWSAHASLSSSFFVLFIIHPSLQLTVVIIVLSYKFLTVGRVDLGTKS